MAGLTIWLWSATNQLSYPLLAADSVTATEPALYPVAEAVNVACPPTSAEFVPAATVTVCGVLQLAVVKVSVPPADTVRSGSVLLPATVTVTLAAGCEESATVNVPVWPCWTVSVVGLTTMLAPSTVIATGLDVVVWFRLSVATAVTE